MYNKIAPMSKNPISEFVSNFFSSMIGDLIGIDLPI
jgi:hypothetical protein